MSATPPDPDSPLEHHDGWSIWPVQDGVHFATRDRPLDDREVRALTMTRTLYAGSRDGLLDKIAKQNRMADELRVDRSGKWGRP